VARAGEVTVQIQRLPHGPEQLPAYQTDGSVGMDLCLAGEDVALDPGQRALLPTGICVAIPEGFEGQVRARSGFALKTGLVIGNAPGTIDQDYRGEVKVVAINVGRERVVVSRGQRIAQLVICPVAISRWEEVAELSQTGRGSGGFGSTGSR